MGRLPICAFFAYAFGPIPQGLCDGSSDSAGDGSFRLMWGGVIYRTTSGFDSNRICPRTLYGADVGSVTGARSRDFVPAAHRPAVARSSDPLREVEDAL